MSSTDSSEIPGLEELPNAPRVTLAPNVTLQPPLSRRGHGPGLIVIDPGYDLPYIPSAELPSTTLDPVPQYKWAEEGYAVLRIAARKTSEPGDWSLEAGFLDKAIESLKSLEECDVKDKFGILLYGTPEEYTPLFLGQLATAVASSDNIVAVVTFSAAFDFASASKPQLVHQAGKAVPTEKEGLTIYTYPEVATDFIMPHSPGFVYSAAAVSHTRSLTFIKKYIGGPIFDLEKIWDEHTYWEFENRSVEKTMATMVREPYVNHIPTMTGGIGRKRLTDFYRNHFIFSNPDSIKMNLVSRTLGVDRIVDEFIFIFNHDKEVDWLLPGIPPTHLPLHIPFYAVVNIRGDRLYHEHISWDQSTALRQLGLLPEYLSFPHAVPGMEGKTLQYKLPVAGVETAEKLEDQRKVDSNTLFMPNGSGIREYQGHDGI
ncbi:unnamed protein product [Penicillium camemberti]|uniref:Str. FM013 n=1 Tax=Penicillium camemberti (strain FM 013) TaxID=1429867 RepID=A0A0G4PHS1_PENC3|nr:unnamed protein product [Penicillium camemberti]